MQPLKLELCEAFTFYASGFAGTITNCPNLFVSDVRGDPEILHLYCVLCEMRSTNVQKFALFRDEAPLLSRAHKRSIVEFGEPPKKAWPPTTKHLKQTKHKL